MPLLLDYPLNMVYILQWLPQSLPALFGSSLHLVSGPTTAISIVVFSAISHHAEPGSAEFLSLALTLTFLAGVYQLAFDLARLGSIVNFVSHTVIIRIDMSIYFGSVNHIQNALLPS
nr:SulP family inorganic anion transporter [Isorropodon fossajaponicum symbiont]